MCQLVTCSTCKKYSYAGCGNHLAAIFAGKKLSELCECPSNTKVADYRRVQKSSNTAKTLAVP